MQKIKIVLGLFFLFLTGSVVAATPYDGHYTFVSRTIAGAPDMVGWSGTLELGSDILSRHYQSADGATKKFYVGPVKVEGDIYVVTFTEAYKPEYVGNTHRNRLSLKDGLLTMTSEDGKFVEVWKKN